MKLISTIDSKNDDNECFRKLNCHCFSYNFYSKMIGFPINLKKEINLRFALMTNQNLTYTKRVKNYLNKQYSYYMLDNFPSISFAFGKTYKNRWFILIIQSDLISYSPSFIRDQFRGWRKILLFNILRLAIQRNVESVYLNTADNINKYYFNSIDKNNNLYKTWKNIYDRSAVEFNMSLTKMNEYIDIQIYPIECEIMTNTFFELKNNNEICFNNVKVY